jgi:hypothetical protein
MCPDDFSRLCLAGYNLGKKLKGLFVWAVCGWLSRESCYVEEAAVQGKLLF